MRKFLRQFSWYRALYPNTMYLKSDGVWKKTTASKVTEVENSTSTQAFCNCGNVLTHTDSFVDSYEIYCADTIAAKIPCGVLWQFKCSSCGETSYWRPDLIPGMLTCDSKGNPL